MVVAKCEVGAAVVDICELGDKLILEETSKVYKKEKDMKKGKLGQMVLCVGGSFEEDGNRAQSEQVFLFLFLEKLSRGGGGGEGGIHVSVYLHVNVRNT